MKLANRALVPVVARGGGTGLAAAAVPLFGGIVVSTERMNQVLEINEDAMYMVVQPGVRTDDVQKAAKEKGLFYAGDPAVATAASSAAMRPTPEATVQSNMAPPAIKSMRSKLLRRSAKSSNWAADWKIDDRLFAGPFGDGSGRDFKYHHRDYAETEADAQQCD